MENNPFSFPVSPDNPPEKPAQASLSQPSRLSETNQISDDFSLSADRAESLTSKLSRTPYVIAVANQKGGVAKTTTVVSLGGALVRYDLEVLLVDLDSQANLTLALGRDPSRVRGTITEVLFNSATLLSVSRETSIPGLDLVLSNADMDVAERFLPMRKNYETILRRSLKESFERPAYIPGREIEHSEEANSHAHPIYDFILLDCPPFMGAVTLNAMVAADVVIIPTQAEYFSAHALRTMMGSIRQVRSQYNPDLIFRILVTMHDRRNRIHRDVTQQIRDTFGAGVFETMIEVDTKLRESAVEGLPITHHRSRSRSALQYDALAQELIHYVRAKFGA
jgi:chromosome partitioning protein